MADNLGDRMKRCYEDRYRIYLTRRTPVILRLDGVAFHTLTRKAKKPFDADFCNAMGNTASFLVGNIQGARCAYTQSDEISVVLVDYNKFTTDAWYDYNIQKIVSVAASIATARFKNTPFAENCEEERGLAFFDCRAFNIPREEVVNYLHWRQVDWRRNSVQMLARSIWSQKQLHGKPVTELKEMLKKNGIPWEGLEDQLKNGMFFRPDTSISTLTQFSKDREYIESLLEPEEK